MYTMAISPALYLIPSPAFGLKELLLLTRDLLSHLLPFISELLGSDPLSWAFVSKFITNHITLQFCGGAAASLTH